MLTYWKNRFSSGLNMIWLVVVQVKVSEMQRMISAILVGSGLISLAEVSPKNWVLSLKLTGAGWDASSRLFLFLCSIFHFTCQINAGLETEFLGACQQTCVKIYETESRLRGQNFQSCLATIQLTTVSDERTKYPPKESPFSLTKKRTVVAVTGWTYTTDTAHDGYPFTTDAPTLHIFIYLFIFYKSSSSSERGVRGGATVWAWCVTTVPCLRSTWSCCPTRLGPRSPRSRSGWAEPYCPTLLYSCESFVASVLTLGSKLSQFTVVGHVTVAQLTVVSGI